MACFKGVFFNDKKLFGFLIEQVQHHLPPIKKMILDWDQIISM